MYRDTNATYKLSDISLEYDMIFNEPYATAMHATKNVYYKNVDSVYQGNIDSLSNTIQQRHYLEDWRE